MLKKILLNKSINLKNRIFINDEYISNLLPSLKMRNYK